MSVAARFLTVDQVLAIHRRMIAEFGGTSEVRDRGLLDSAVAMPQAQFGGTLLHPGTAEMAAAYLFHICKNHPFVDGNIRTALASAITFLKANARDTRATDDELGRMTFGVADGSTSKDELTAFVRERVRSIE